MEGETEILRLFHQHRRLIDAGERAVADPEAGDTELDALYFDPAEELERRISALPCTCAGDFAAKAIMETTKGGFCPNWQTRELWKEARRLTGCGL